MTGLLQLGAGEVGTAPPAVLGYWRELGRLLPPCVSRLPRRSFWHWPRQHPHDRSVQVTPSPTRTSCELTSKSITPPAGLTLVFCPAEE